MTREDLTSVASATLDRFSPSDIDRPIETTSLDSLDLLTLRAALETRIGASISDEDWFASRSLAELIARLP